jgi:hypothetical protein
LIPQEKEKKKDSRAYVDFHHTRQQRMDSIAMIVKLVVFIIDSQGSTTMSSFSFPLKPNQQQCNRIMGENQPRICFSSLARTIQMKKKKKKNCL